MRRVLVTGGTGFIGRRVVSRFLDAGWEATSFSLPGEHASLEWSRSVRMIHGDVCSPEDVRRAAEDATLIVHLAAIVGVPGEYERQWTIIADGTRNIIQAAFRNSARVLVASSIAVYGDKIQRQTCREDDGHGLWQGAYGRAKQDQETITLDAMAKGLRATIVRPANVYGLGGTSAWGDRFIQAIEQTGGAVFGDGDANNAGLVFVENLADAIFLAATDDRAIGRIYNVCDEEPVTWGRYTDDLAKIAKKPKPPRLPLDPLMQMAMDNEDPANLIGPKDVSLPSLEGLNLVGFSNRFDASRIRSELGWKSRIQYSDAIDQMSKAWARSRSTAVFDHGS
jgi:2-alkyl-3-oxoalkanoate reductase